MLPCFLLGVPLFRNVNGLRAGNQLLSLCVFLFPLSSSHGNISPTVCVPYCPHPIVPAYMRYQTAAVDTPVAPATPAGPSIVDDDDDEAPDTAAPSTAAPTKKGGGRWPKKSGESLPCVYACAVACLPWRSLVETFIRNAHHTALHRILLCV